MLRRQSTAFVSTFAYHLKGEGNMVYVYPYKYKLVLKMNKIFEKIITYFEKNE